MQLILRVTDRCNFKCDFCSASDLSVNHDLDLDLALSLIDKYKPCSVMLEGGDPLVCKPSYINAILQRVKQDNSITELGITTNLWDFWKHPEKWVDILSDEKVSVCTSFQYGNRRKLSDKLILTDDLFEQIYTKFNQLTHKRINFISVLDYDNEQHVFDTIALAKKLNTYCKINPVFKSGRSDHNYPFHRAIRIYTDIIERGLGDVVDNCYTLLRVVGNQHVDRTCPYIRDCSDVFRVVSPDGIITNCSIYGSVVGHNSQPLQEIDVVSCNPCFVCSDCLSCRCFDVCNGCRMKIAQIRRDNDLKTHCAVIKECYDTIKQYVADNELYD